MSNSVVTFDSQLGMSLSESNTVFFLSANGRRERDALSAREVSRRLALRLRGLTEEIRQSFEIERVRLSNDERGLEEKISGYRHSFRAHRQTAAQRLGSQASPASPKDGQLVAELATLPLRQKVDHCLSKLDSLENSSQQLQLEIDNSFGPGNKWFWIIPVIVFMSVAGSKNAGVGAFVALGFLAAEFAAVYSWKATRAATIESNSKDSLWLVDQGEAALNEFLALSIDDLNSEKKEMLAEKFYKIRGLEQRANELWDVAKMQFKILPLTERVKQNERIDFRGDFRLGSYLSSMKLFGPDDRPPFVFDAVESFISSQSLILLTSDESGRQLTVDTVNAFCERMCSEIPPDELEFLLVDPLGRGGNLAGLSKLAEYEPKLISGRIWTEERNVDEQLRDVIQHIENVLQNALGTQYADFNEYNSSAGSLKIARKVVVMLDLPNSLSEESWNRLRSILAHGPKCGVFCLLTCDLFAEPKWIRVSKSSTTAKTETDSAWISELCNFSNVKTLIAGAKEFELVYDAYDDRDNAELPRLTVLPEARLDRAESERIYSRFGDAVQKLPARAVSFPTRAISWDKTNADGLVVSIGEVSTKKLQTFKIDEVLLGHALIAGVAGSGKSNLLHVLITNLALHYSPQELSLYLVDFKQGVEFKRYADYQLPHAKVVAIQSEREFGLSILRSLFKEIERRGRLFKEADVQNLSAYRAKVAAPLTRAVLLMDEYQVLLGGDDKIATEARHIFDTIARQGRAMGIHLVLASQSITQGQLEEATRSQMGIRIALRLSEADARRIFSDDNNKAVYLKRAGEAIYNNTNGREEGNSRFQVFSMADDVQKTLLAEIQQVAATSGIKDRPIIFDGSTSCSMTESTFFADARPRDNKLSFVFGEPTTLDGPVSARLIRQRQHNILVVGTNNELVRDLFSSAIMSAAKVLDTLDGSQFVDFSSSDDPEHQHYEDLCEAIGRGLKYSSRRSVDKVIDTFYLEVKRRSDEELGHLPARILFINRLQVARDLEYDDYSTAGSDLSTAQKFAYILRNGSEFGMHVAATADSPERAFKVLSRSLQREFGLRIGTQMAEESSRAYFGDATGQRIGPSRAVLFDDELDRRELIRPYKIPPLDWIRNALSS